jgi:hypothetical protein
MSFLDLRQKLTEEMSYQIGRLMDCEDLVDTKNWFLELSNQLSYEIIDYANSNP